MKAREVWFAIPSANPELCRQTLPRWRDMGYKIAVLQNHRRGDIPADIVRWSDHYPGWAASINLLCREVVPASADIVVSGGDDMLPDPNFTAQELAEEFYDRFPDGFGVMQPHGDDWGKTQHYCGSPWLGRGWIECANGGRGPMNPEYHHNWADCELYWVAKCLGVLWSRPELTQRHEHFLRNGAPKPAYWESVERNGARGLQTLLARKHAHFPGAMPAGRPFTFDSRPIDFDPHRFAERRAVHYLKVLIDETQGKPRMNEAIGALASAGVERIALYGAGAHTRALSGTLRDCPLEVACIVDDDPARQGGRLWGFPIVSPAEALRQFAFEAVLLSSDAHEAALWQKCKAFRERGVPTLRVYTGPGVLADLRQQREVAHAAA